LKPDGMLGVVLPHGILFRGGTEGKIRKGLLENDLVEAVIGLAPNLFYGTGIPACVLLINKAKAAKRKGKVLFVNGAEKMVEGKNQNSLSEENVRRLSEGFHAYEDEDRFSRVVSLEEIQKNDFNLNIARYVQIAEEEKQIDVASELNKLKKFRIERDGAEERMMQFIEDLGYDT